jgi:hypothetical protein
VIGSLLGAISSFGGVAGARGAWKISKDKSSLKLVGINLMSRISSSSAFSLVYVYGDIWKRVNSERELLDYARVRGDMGSFI